MKFKLFCLVLCSLLLASCEKNSEFEHAMALIENRNPFNYKLNVRYSIGKNKNILLCNHGFGGNSHQFTLYWLCELERNQVLPVLERLNAC